METDEKQKSTGERFGDFNFHLKDVADNPLFKPRQLAENGVWVAPPELRPKNWREKYPEIKEPQP